MNFNRIIRFFRRIFFLNTTLEVYTDGSHKGKWGSWAFVVVKNQKIIIENSGRVRNSDSHHMEFQSVIEALKHFKKSKSLIFFTDSRVLLDAVTGKAKRKAVNPEQLETILELAAKHNISWQWVRAHAGNKFNERCDELCHQARS